MIRSIPLQPAMLTSAPVWQITSDYDNGFSLTKFDNNTTAYIQVGRTATCSHVESEIVGTKGTLRVNSVPRKNYLSQFTENGFVEECQESFLASLGRSVPGGDRRLR